MTARILTEVSARVDANREIEWVEAFHALTAGAVPDGLVRTEITRGQDGQWRTQTLWRDRFPKPLGAPRHFTNVGAEARAPGVGEIEDDLVAPE